MSDSSMINTPEWASVIKRLLRAEMALNDVSYSELSKRLEARFGTRQTENNLKAKINKGVLGAQLFLQVLAALDKESLNIHDAINLLTDIQQNTTDNRD